eukprot:CAMPEP_0194540186 /NCGR_PEP_ID=MMETSP0253-20130528/80364_1 /TAXON_ID=2966 /ORGANISM="Noctiluca scintillans" /LENGTH=105 /DNA_ID=CAMNT_0039386535 /DNA_START=426 /DNA_END=744 /DNA_ORIENTATION=-
MITLSSVIFRIAVCRPRQPNGSLWYCLFTGIDGFKPLNLKNATCLEGSETLRDAVPAISSSSKVDDKIRMGNCGGFQTESLTADDAFRLPVMRRRATAWLSTMTQ